MFLMNTWIPTLNSSPYDTMGLAQEPEESSLCVSIPYQGNKLYINLVVS